MARPCSSRAAFTSCSVVPALKVAVLEAASTRTRPWMEGRRGEGGGGRGEVKCIIIMIIMMIFKYNDCVSQEEQNDANFSSVAPSSEEQKGHKE